MKYRNGFEIRRNNGEICVHKLHLDLWRKTCTTQSFRFSLRVGSSISKGRQIDGACLWHVGKMSSNRNNRGRKWYTKKLQGSTFSLWEQAKSLTRTIYILQVVIWWETCSKFRWGVKVAWNSKQWGVKESIRGSKRRGIETTTRGLDSTHITETDTGGGLTKKPTFT